MTALIGVVAVVLVVLFSVRAVRRDRAFESQRSHQRQDLARHLTRYEYYGNHFHTWANGRDNCSWGTDCPDGEADGHG